MAEAPSASADLPAGLPSVDGLRADDLFPEGTAFIRQQLRRSAKETESIESVLETMPIAARQPAMSKARATFERFDVNGDGVIEMNEVLLGLRDLGVRCTPEEARAIFEELDTDGSGVLEVHEFAGLAERMEREVQQRVWPKDVERLAAAARALHEESLTDPLALVAQGEVSTLVRCAACGHQAVQQLGLTALAIVSAAPSPHCGGAVGSHPELPPLLAKLGAPTTCLPSLRLGVRLLGTLCAGREHDLSLAKLTAMRTTIRRKTFRSAMALLRGVQARLGAEPTPARHAALALGGFAAEPDLAAEMAADAEILRYSVALSDSAEPATRAAAVEAVCACVEAGDGAAVPMALEFGALAPLLAAAAVPDTDGLPPVAAAARRALKALDFKKHWASALPPEVVLEAQLPRPKPSEAEALADRARLVEAAAAARKRASELMAGL